MRPTEVAAVLGLDLDNAIRPVPLTDEQIAGAAAVVAEAQSAVPVDDRQPRPRQRIRRVVGA